MEHLARSYEKGIQLTSQQPEKLILNLGCQFWLANIYAYKLGREEDALRLWESLIGCCDRIWHTFFDSEGTLNRIHLLTFEELSRRGVTKDAVDKIVDSDRLFLMTRKLILIGKAMERQNLDMYARGVYAKIVRRCLALDDEQSVPEIFRCLGDALVALGECEDALNAFRVSITVGALCDGCIAISGSPALAKSIRESRFKCLSCAEIDLCGECFTARKQGLISIALRDCSPEHKFMRIPCLGEDPDGNAGASATPVNKTLKKWLRELCAKYDVDLPIV
jgi:Zinc finger, ZZ type